jgi:anti-sigma factor RsiW
MTENICRYSGDRERAIVSYLYGDGDGFDLAERAAFDAHLATCHRCSSELAAFEEVRTSLQRWSPPGLHPSDRPSLGAASASARAARYGETSPKPGEGGRPRQPSPDPLAPGPRSWGRDIPAWAQVGAALVCLGIGAGLANLNVRYDGNGLQVRTGWSAALPAPLAQTSQPATVTVGSPGDAGSDAAPWRAELIALEQRLRADLRRPAPNVISAAANSGTLANGASADMLRRVRALVGESERRQQTELALRLAEAVREMTAQRQADLVRIDRSIGAMQNNTGREMLRQRNEMLNYVSVRTAAQRPQ